MLMMIQLLMLCHSVARQCVHCCKGDAASQWEMATLGVSELLNKTTSKTCPALATMALLHSGEMLLKKFLDDGPEPGDF